MKEFTNPFLHPSNVRSETSTQQVHSAVSEGGEVGAAFLGSVLAGMFLGLIADHWLGTDPWFVVSGVVLGSYSGFMRLWKYSERLVDDPRGR